ncbi:siderophore-interacting protein [Jatrophihabitans telluris]|uniref:Siderophore-interacting protein n=1 Tax=Jatrophihabitans telluris TaxID=2038343 RepID=A0ABY4R0Q9_9ACTN|nr:siderophore-interacting protein [Jatrophihabitans telluris]UQX88740.1 siderophore-interacting protein [Jatrophihabitans telluris]
MSSVQHITRTGQFRTDVTNVADLSPRMRRITLTGADIAAQDWPLGCDIAVVLDGADLREVRRRYTVRAVSGADLVLDAVLHGHGPGSTWAAEIEPGQQVTFFGPRGAIDTPSADWLLALTDESGLPAIAAIAEAHSGVPETPRLRVFAEIANEHEHYPLPDNTEVTWVTRGHAAPGYSDKLADALTGYQPPTGRGYAYVLGESRAVVALREALAVHGLSRADVYAKGYWNLNSRPTR